MVQVQIVPRDVCRVTHAEWRGNQELCKVAAGAMTNPTVRQMLDVLRTSHLGGYVLAGATIEARAIHQARCEGYGMALNDFEALAVFQNQTQDLKATFQEPEPE